MAVELTFSRELAGSKKLLVEFSDRRLTEKGEITYSRNKPYESPQNGDRPWLKNVVDALLSATDHDLEITIRPRTITVKAKQPITDLNREKLKSAVLAPIQGHGLPVVQLA